MSALVAAWQVSHGAVRYEGTALLSVSVDKRLAVRLRERLAWQSGWQARRQRAPTPEGTTQTLRQQYPFFKTHFAHTALR